MVRRVRYAEEGHSHSGLGLPSVSGHAPGEVLTLGGSSVPGWAVPAAPSLVLDDLTDVSAASPTSGHYLKWNGTAWIPAAVPAAAGFDFRGAWDVGTAYTTGQVVRRTNGSKDGLYIATAGSTGTDPAAAPIASFGSIARSGSTSSWGATISQAFQSSSAKSIKRVKIKAASGGIASGSTVEIRSGAWNGSVIGSATSAATAGSGTDATFDFASPVAISASTTYWLYISSTQGAVRTTGPGTGTITAPQGLNHGVNGSVYSGYFMECEFFEATATAWDLILQDT